MIQEDDTELSMLTGRQGRCKEAHLFSNLLTLGPSVNWFEVLPDSS